MPSGHYDMGEINTFVDPNSNNHVYDQLIAWNENKDGIFIVQAWAMIKGCRRDYTAEEKAALIEEYRKKYIKIDRLTKDYRIGDPVPNYSSKWTPKANNIPRYKNGYYEMILNLPYDSRPVNLTFKTMIRTYTTYDVELMNREILKKELRPDWPKYDKKLRERVLHIDDKTEDEN